MHCPRRLTLHHHAQNAVDARLVALAMTLEPIEHVLNPDEWLVTFSPAARLR
jgi:hypothetical protein